jgi:calcium-dependent protein kinase
MDNADNDEKIAQAVLRGNIDFNREPWPRVSANAKDLIRRMLDPNPSTRLTARQVLGKPPSPPGLAGLHPPVLLSADR